MNHEDNFWDYILENVIPILVLLFGLFVGIFALGLITFACLWKTGII